MFQIGDIDGLEFVGHRTRKGQGSKAGAPRRFVDPSLMGAGIIIPPIRPGWAGANASVLRQAAMLAEGHEDSLTGLTDEEAVNMVSQIINYAGTPAEGATA